MASPYIDFISAYCDGWCERCPFTERCSAFACRTAIAMTGDVSAGIELAVGDPADPDEPPSTQPPAGHFLPDDLEEPTPEEIAEFQRGWEQLKAKIDANPLSRRAYAHTQAALAWIEAHRELAEHADPIVVEAFAVACWDLFLIEVKLMRALHGQESLEDDDLTLEERLQSDWNGSAKVALLSIDRSAQAWTLLGGILNDAAAISVAEGLDDLRALVDTVFPHARAFKRPGFDEPM